MPKWYKENARFPEEMSYITKEDEEKRKELRDYVLIVKKEELKELIDKSIEEENEADFIKHSVAYNNLNEE